MGRLGSTRAWWPAALAVLAALLQLDFLVESFLPGGPPITRSQISELSAPGQPAAWLFQVCDISTGLLILAIVPGWWRASRTVSVCLAVWGLGLALAAAFTASCADSLHPHCEGNGLPGPHAGLRNNMHDIGSIASVLALLLGILWAALVLRRNGYLGRGALVGWLSVLCCALGLFETGEDIGGVTYGRGISQRLQVILLSVVVVLLADPRRWPFAGRWRAPDPAVLSPRPSRTPSAS